MRADKNPVPKGQGVTARGIFCPRYQVKDKRVLGATQFPVRGQGTNLLDQPSFPHSGRGQTWGPSSLEG